MVLGGKRKKKEAKSFKAKKKGERKKKRREFNCPIPLEGGELCGFEGGWKENPSIAQKRKGKKGEELYTLMGVN